MKKKLLAVLCSAAMLAAAGCGSTPAANTPASATPSSQPQESVQPTATPEPESTTRKVSTIMGEIEVPANPQRVVVNWYIGDPFTLGLNVVGYSAWAQETMPFYDKFDPAEKITNWAQEDVMALDPDLIITYSQEDFETFSKIAPVLVIPESDVSSEERLRIIAEATGRSEIAEEAIKVFEEKLADARQKLNAGAFEGKTFSIMEDWGPSGEWSGVAYETGSRGGTLVYKYLGLKKTEKLEQLIAETGKGRATLSYEIAHEYFGDYILWFRQEGKESEYSKTEIWKSIPAVAEGRLVEIPGKYQGLFYYDDVASLTAQLDYIVDALNQLAQ